MLIRARRFVPVVLLIVIATALVGADQSAAPGAAPTRVSILASVLSKRGIFVSDLTKDEFEVLDNGKRQPLTLFENKIQPIALVVLIDRSGTLGWDPNLVWQAAERLVAGTVRPGDKARVGTFSSKIIIAPPDFTGDLEALQKAFTESIQGAGPTPLWNAASAAIDALAAQPGRRVLLIVSQNRDAPEKAGATLVDVRARAQANDVAVYGIGLAAQAARGALAPGAQRQQGRGAATSSGGESGSKPLSGGSGTPDPGLKTLATETGGDYFDFESGISVPASFEFIADELHHQYVLGLTAAVLDGKVHTIDVRVKRPGVTVNARKTYVASPGK